MIELHPGDLLGPAGGLALLMHYDGMTRDQAFDAVADHATDPEFQEVIAQFETTPDGRKLLADVMRSWDREGLPCPWDNVLELKPT